MTESLIIVDLGCKFGIHPSHLPIRDQSFHFMIDADQEEIDYLSGYYKGNDNFRFVSRFISDSIGAQKFFLYSHRGGHSKYKPDLNRKYWTDLRKGSGNLVGEVSVDATTLDFLCDEFNIVDPDFLKVDVEGEEVAALAGARNILLNSIVGVRVEVLLNSLYENLSPTFAGVDAFLRSVGFDFLYFDNVPSNAYAPFSEFYGTTKPYGQLIGVDAIYVKSPTSLLSGGSLRKVLNLAIFAMLQGASDLSYFVMTEAKRRSLYLPERDQDLKQIRILERLFAKAIFSFQDTPGRSLPELQKYWSEIFYSPCFGYGEFYRKYPSA